MSKANRNDPCPCGSGLKYKKCCAKADAVRQQKKRTSSGLFPRISGAKKPTAAQTFAHRVMKVITAPSKVPSPGEASAGHKEERAYTTLEELIGVEGPPPPMTVSGEEQTPS